MGGHKKKKYGRNTVFCTKLAGGRTEELTKALFCSLLGTQPDSRLVPLLRRRKRPVLNRAVLRRKYQTYIIVICREAVLY